MEHTDAFRARGGRALRRLSDLAAVRRRRMRRSGLSGLHTPTVPREQPLRLLLQARTSARISSRGGSWVWFITQVRPRVNGDEGGIDVLPKYA